MQRKYLYTILAVSILAVVACSTVDSQATFNSAQPRETADLTTPPGLATPELNKTYQMPAKPGGVAAYQFKNQQGMYIASGGSQRWLVIESNQVEKMWPLMIAYVNQLGLTVKYQNLATGVIQSDWASRNTKVPQGTSLRGLFDWVGWGSMYSLNSMYMFKINLWQDGKHVIVMDSNYQMDEEYLGCRSPGAANTSSLASSDQQQTKWVARGSNPQLELEFLTKFMAFAGLPTEEVAKAVAVAKQPVENAQVVNNQVVINDQFDRAWWRSAVALERVNLGIVDKDRSKGEYYVYPLQAQLNNPDPSFLQRWFGRESASSIAQAKAVYTVKLSALGNQTIITLMPYEGTKVEKDFNAKQQKYLADLAKQLQ